MNPIEDSIQRKEQVVTAAGDRLKNLWKDVTGGTRDSASFLNYRSKYPGRVTPALRVLTGESAAVPTSALRIGGGALGGLLAGGLLGKGLTPPINPEGKEKDARSIRRKRLLIALAMAAAGGGVAAGAEYRNQLKGGIDDLSKGFSIPG